MATVHPSGSVADCQESRLGSQNPSLRLEMAADPQIHTHYPAAMTDFLVDLI
ncbi:MAG: hypothetical protein AAFR66_15555 [Bacteroidota bacterium]